jgi:hypothetical protein
MDTLVLVGVCLMFVMFVALGLFFLLFVIAAARLERLDKRLDWEEFEERLVEAKRMPPEEPLPPAEGQGGRAYSPTTSVPPE